MLTTLSLCFNFDHSLLHFVPLYYKAEWNDKGKSFPMCRNQYCNRACVRTSRPKPTRSRPKAPLGDFIITNIFLYYVILVIAYIYFSGPAFATKNPLVCSCPPSRCVCVCVWGTIELCWRETQCRKHVICNRIHAWTRVCVSLISLYSTQRKADNTPMREGNPNSNQREQCLAQIDSKSYL